MKPIIEMITRLLQCWTRMLRSRDQPAWRTRLRLSIELRLSKWLRLATCLYRGSQGGGWAVVLVSEWSEIGQVQFCCPTGCGGTVCLAVPRNLIEELYMCRAQWEMVDHSALGQQKTRAESDVALQSLGPLGSSSTQYRRTPEIVL